MRRLVVLALLTLAACSSEATSADRKYAAFDVCTQYVKDRLKAPGNATFRDPTVDNGQPAGDEPYQRPYVAGDTVITPSSDGTVYVISSSVDSENGFGAKLRSTWQCAVKHVSGDKWQLKSLDIQDGGDISP